MDKLIAIVGPTASGKTAFSVALAKRFGGTIIAADSRTVYRGMNIGTAKPTLQEMGGVEHVGFDLKNPDEDFSVGEFKIFADAEIQKIVKAGKVPFLVGGTGLYIDAVLRNYGFEDRNKDSAYESLEIGIELTREELNKRVDARVDTMLQAGLIDEVAQLREKYGCNTNAMSGIGYKQICGYLEGEYDLDRAVELLKRDTRRYAKRQMTWFRHHGDVKWVKNVDEAGELVREFLF